MPEMHEPFIETDAAGRLYDRRVREHLRRDVPENEVAATEALAALRLASHGFRNRMDRWLERHDMSEGRLSVLWRLRAKGSLTLGEVAESLDVSARNITGLVDHLERDALVERFPDPEDRRAIRVRLAPAGKQKLADIKREMGSARHGMVAGFTDEELSQLRHLCLKLAQNTIAHRELEKV
ncbi:MAG: MarR family transcriptional regulator [Chloroflexi bacterium]|nr:MAG: MarR family transcriptional regulator [Chloroflexota bacterium]TMC69568.1 MAG: MarR family transcriptional regulator [Chloroflexota bacterium]